MQHASTQQKGLGDRLEAIQMSPHLRQNLVAGLPCTEQVITDFRASLHWAGDRCRGSASDPCTAVHSVTRFGSSGLAEARLLLVVFQSLWICLVNPIPASATSVSTVCSSLAGISESRHCTECCRMCRPLPRQLSSLLNSCRSTSQNSGQDSKIATWHPVI